MESKTYLKNLDIPPKKLRMLLPSIKKLSPLEATSVLFYSPKRSALIFYKAIKSAMANAKQTLKVNDDLLQFKLFTVEEGNKLKRYTAGSRGSAKPFKKRYSHIKIVLTSKSTEEVSQKVQKALSSSDKNTKKEVIKTEATLNVDSPKKKNTDSKVKTAKKKSNSERTKVKK